MKLRLAAYAALTLVLAGCGGGGSSLNTGQAGSITGRAIDAQGHAIPGAAVSLAPAGRNHLDPTHTTTTDVEGSFTLNNVAAGTYTMEITATTPTGGTTNVVIDITVPAGTTLDLTVRVSQSGGGIINPPLSGTGTLSGVVLDEDGRPLAGMRVKAENERTDQELTTATDSQGRFTFNNLQAGLWRVWADPTGRERSDRVWVEVLSNQTSQTTIRFDD